VRPTPAASGRLREDLVEAMSFGELTPEVIRNLPPGTFADEISHASTCATNSGPALPTGSCDCGADAATRIVHQKEQEIAALREVLQAFYDEGNGHDDFEDLWPKVRAVLGIK
jgi:hypothetical protein